MLARTTWEQLQSVIHHLSLSWIRDCDRDPCISRYTVVTVIAATLSSLSLSTTRLQQGAGHITSRTYPSRAREGIPTKSILAKSHGSPMVFSATHQWSSK